ncbi:MAG: hypothetical protein JW720_02550 [Sedimentisphaerales bacterium]|nr:hypothetical protein [Sedimentisphaerales bacterium]
MENNSYSRIQPVETLKHVAGLTPVKERDRRNRKRRRQQKHDEHQRQQPQNTIENNHDHETGGNKTNTNSIDYCA